MHDTPHSEESKKKMSDSHKGIVNNARRRKTIVKDGITLYQCGICKEFKPYEEFYKNKRTILGITPERQNARNAIANDGEDKPNCDLALLARHFKADNISTEFDRPLPQKGDKYRHFKLGKIVTIIGISRHTETEEISVVYEYEGHIWNRPLEMFMSEVNKELYPNAKQRYRFERLNNVLV
jgi:hypothetical protein